MLLNRLLYASTSSDARLLSVHTHRLNLSLIFFAISLAAVVAFTSVTVFLSTTAVTFDGPAVQ